LERAVSLYRGNFLEGFAGHVSSLLEDWISLTRDQLAGEMQEALADLVAICEEHGDYVRAESALRQRLALEPWQEGVHRDLMRLLARSGQRGAALAQYRVCVQVLREELAVEPARDTVALYERIRDRQFSPAILTPSALRLGISRVAAERAVDQDPVPAFVSRERELACLDTQLTEVLAGRGRVSLVTGDAGSGKTALLTEFSRLEMDRHGDVVFAAGSCNAYAGSGDPYLPFREVIELLTGDLESKRAGGSVSPDQARRLWSLFPTTLQALLDSGPDLIDSFVAGPGLLERGQTLGPPDAANAVAELDRFLRHKRHSSIPGYRQPNLFEQVTRVLQRVAHRQPLVLVLDDLQWADRGSISLLFHLGRRLAGSRIFVLGAYRSDELTPDLRGDRHPLVTVVDELRRDFGDIVVGLDDARGRRFVDALLDAYPNHLDHPFRERLTHHTGGHALFTVELLRGLVQQGDLLKDRQGCWVEGASLDWNTLPARIEAVIGEHVERLPAALRETLRVASVEGEEFTAEVSARVLGKDDREILRQLSGPLAREHRLVMAQSLNRSDHHTQSRYRFRHFLFQAYLYSHLDGVERARRHEAVGLALEELYGEQTGEIAAQLARHFKEAGLAARAVSYLLRAGDRALQLQAHQEALIQYRQGLILLEGLPESPERDLLERDLQLGVGSALYGTEGLGSAGKMEAQARAYNLSRKLGQSADLWPALHALASASTARGEHQQALELSEELLDLVRLSGDPAQLALDHFTVGERLFAGGDLVRAREHLEQAIAHYDGVADPRAKEFLTTLKGFDLGVNARAWLAMVLWILGYPDQAAREGRAALSLARKLDHVLSLVLGLYAVSQVHHSRGEDDELRVYVRELSDLMSGRHMLVGDAWVDVFSGWLEVRAGRATEGLARMVRGKAAWEATGAVFGSIAQAIAVVEACLLAGKPGEGLPVTIHALSVMKTASLYTDEAELYRLRGEVVLACGDHPDVARAEAESLFRRAIEVARTGQARSWELRAATSLARLWHSEGKGQDARAMLAPIYGWFTEGLETLDLRDAEALLAESGSLHPTVGGDPTRSTNGSVVR
jgi:tetratricopeptide (TPR) repeat protein